MHIKCYRDEFVSADSEARDGLHARETTLTACVSHAGDNGRLWLDVDIEPKIAVVVRRCADSQIGEWLWFGMCPGPCVR